MSEDKWGPTYEAIQFGEFAPWHAVRLPDSLEHPNDETMCGRSALNAERMWLEWDEFGDGERCKQCVKAIAKASR